MKTPARALAFCLLVATWGCAGAAPGARERAATVAISADDVRAHVAALCAEEMQGRLTGTEGERLATQYVADAFAGAGLAPAGTGGGWFQPFEFTAGVSLGPGNRLRARAGGGAWREPVVEVDWRPLAFSRTGDAGAAPVVFAGYGIVAPENGGGLHYDSYEGLDVAGRWVLLLRYAPQDVQPEERQRLSRYASLRHKLMLARDRGALGVLIASGPRSAVREQLVALANDPISSGGSSMVALSVSDALADSWLSGTGHTLATLQAALDGGPPQRGFEIPALRVSAQVDLVQERRSGRNVLGRLRTPRGGDAAPVLIGAHVDHLGTGLEGSSLAREDERGRVHPGADDNASGVAALIEIGRVLAARLHSEPDSFARDVLFAAWSGEEIGLVGSTAFARDLPDALALAHGAPRPLAAVLNLDMVGRLRDRLILQGTGSSSAWPALIERANATRGLPLTLEPESYLPTDSTSFHMKGIPVLSAFTGAHAEYHTPRDTPDTLDDAGLARVADLIAAIAGELALSSELPDRAEAPPGEALPPRAELRAYLGTIPSYSGEPGPGVLLSGVSPGGPAERAGLRAGDRVVELAGHAIDNIYDYTFALEAVTIGKAVPIAVLRDGARLTLEITPASRE